MSKTAFGILDQVKTQTRLYSYRWLPGQETNKALQLQMTTGLKFRILNLVKLFCPGSEEKDDDQLRLDKSTFWICKNEGADQLCSNCTADQGLRFPYTDSAVSLLSKS